MDRLIFKGLSQRLQSAQRLSRDTLRTLRIADLWESIAMPEIRVQAAALAELLVTEAHPSTPLRSAQDAFTSLR